MKLTNKQTSMTDPVKKNHSGLASFYYHEINPQIGPWCFNWFLKGINWTSICHFIFPNLETDPSFEYVGYVYIVIGGRDYMFNYSHPSKAGRIPLCSSLWRFKRFLPNSWFASQNTTSNLDISWLIFNWNVTTARGPLGDLLFEKRKKWLKILRKSELQLSDLPHKPEFARQQSLLSLNLKGNFHRLVSAFEHISLRPGSWSRVAPWIFQGLTGWPQIWFPWFDIWSTLKSHVFNRLWRDSFNDVDPGVMNQSLRSF